MTVFIWQRCLSNQYHPLSKFEFHRQTSSLLRHNSSLENDIYFIDLRSINFGCSSITRMYSWVLFQVLRHSFLVVPLGASFLCPHFFGFSRHLEKDKDFPANIVWNKLSPTRSQTCVWFFWTSEQKGHFIELISKGFLIIYVTSTEWKMITKFFYNRNESQLKAYFT